MESQVGLVEGEPCEVTNEDEFVRQAQFGLGL